MDKSYTLPLGSFPPDFHLKGTNRNFYTLSDFASAEVLVIFFTCNHCPYVKNSNTMTCRTVEKYQNKNVRFIGINSNNEVSYPEDSYEEMVKEMRVYHFPWIYPQEIARSYGALRTPHFFVFNQQRHLIYTGRSIDSPFDPSKMTINDLENALNDHFLGQPVKIPLTHPIGCTIKWIDKEKHGTPAEACDLT